MAHGSITVHFKDSRQHDITIKIQDGYSMSSPFNDSWSIMDLDGKQWLFNWGSILYTELVNGIPD